MQGYILKVVTSKVHVGIQLFIWRKMMYLVAGGRGGVVGVGGSKNGPLKPDY